MTGTELLERIGYVDPDLIQEAERALSKKGKGMLRRQIIAAITAACLILLAGVGAAFGLLSRTNVTAPSGCLMIGSPINSRSPNYYSKVNQHSSVKALEAWSKNGADGDPTIRISGSGTLRFGIEFVVTFDSAIASDIPEEERALIAAFIGWTQSPDYERTYECYQQEFVQKEVLDKIERSGGDYEEMLQIAANIYETTLPFDSTEVVFRVMGYASDESDSAVQRNRSFLERDLTDIGLDPAKIERFLCFTLADEPVMTYDGVLRTDPSDPVIPDRSQRYLYRYDGIWYYDNRTLSDSLLDLTLSNYTNQYFSTAEREGDVVWVNGSYCRVATGTEDVVLHVNAPSLLAGIAAGDRIGYTYFTNVAIEGTLLIEECDQVTVTNASVIEKR